MKSFWQTFGEQLYRKVTKSSLQSRRTKRFAASLPQHLLFIARSSFIFCQFLLNYGPWLVLTIYTYIYIYVLVLKIARPL